MAITFERFGSRRTQADNNHTSVELLWRVEGTDDELEVRALVGQESAPIYLDSLTNRLLFRADHDCTQVGPAQWDVTVNYRNDEASDQQQSTFSFDTSGATGHITQSFGTKKYGTNAPDHKSAIGVRDKEVEGVDIVVPSLKFSETWPLPASMVTTSYVNTLAGLTGTVNQSAWRNYPAESVLFLGASGQSQSDGIVPVTFSFDVSPNATLTIAGISSIDKRGWEYLWTQYTEEEDTDAKRFLKKPKWVYVETVYKKTDFSAIGI